VSGRFGGLGADEDALQTDVYIESLLSRQGLGPATATGAAPDEDDVLRAARLLGRGLVRFHPSFRFEEALAARLRRAADLMRAGGQIMASDAPDTLDAFQGRSAIVAGPPVVFETRPAVPGHHAFDPRARGLLVGGAIASGVSLAGAVVLVWRRNRRGLD
jgi:hypothetical protein